MIKNIIFDIGGVLTKFDPNDYLSPFGFDPKTASTLSEAIFKNQFWKSYMVGQISPSQFKRAILNANPSLKNEVEFVLDKSNTAKMLPRLESGVKFLLDMKAQGYNIFILSNIVENSLLYFKSSFPDVCKVISGAIYSCEAHLKKPDERIYNILTKKYNLTPAECLFLDDSEKNVQAAKNVGMKSILCQPTTQKDAFSNVSQFLEKTK